MKITILNGSPKGNKSVSLQSARYILKKFNKDDHSIINISKSINKIENNIEEFEAILSEIKKSDLILFVSPVYSLLIPSQYKKFIELIFEKKQEKAFKNKNAAVITTSINFFDHCASDYLKNIAEDMGMKFYGSFSADSYDLLDENERMRLEKFGKMLFYNVENNLPMNKEFVKSAGRSESFKEDIKISKTIEPENKKIVIVKDINYKNHNLEHMINALTRTFNNKVEILNLSDINIISGCTGCIQCGFDHKCMFDGKDDFVPFFNEKIANADILIIAGEIRDRWLSSKWKEFFDRSFFNNHIPVLKEKQIGALISGPFSSTPNLKEILKAFSQWQGANLTDIVTDENPENMGKKISDFAEKIEMASNLGYIEPATFLGKGGHKIFRDDIWGRHRFVFQTDNKWYEENNFYDFPQYDQDAIEMSENMIKLTKDPAMREAVRKMLKSEMVKPHIKIVEE